MNITKEITKLAGRGNIGTDKETVQTRFKESFAESTKTQKDVIAKLAGKATTSLYNIGKAGTIDAKTAVALGYTLNVSPFWFTGADSDKREFSEEIFGEFIAANTPKKEKKVTKSENKVTRKYTRKEKPGVVAETEQAEESTESAVVSTSTHSEKTEETPVVVVEEAENAAEQVVKTITAPVVVAEISAPVRAINLSLESAETLLSALFIRSEFDDSAKEKLQRVFAELV